MARVVVGVECRCRLTTSRQRWHGGDKRGVGAEVVGGVFLLLVQDEHVLRDGDAVALNHLGGHLMAAIETSNERQQQCWRRQRMANVAKIVVDGFETSIVRTDGLITLILPMETVGKVDGALQSVVEDVLDGCLAIASGRHWRRDHGAQLLCDHGVETRFEI